MDAWIVLTSALVWTLGAYAHPGQEFIVAFPAMGITNLFMTPELDDIEDVQVTISDNNPESREKYTESIAISGLNTTSLVLPREMTLRWMSFKEPGHGVLVSASRPIWLQVRVNERENWLISDASFLAIPRHQLGTEYFVFSYSVLHVSTFSFLVVIATLDNTTATATLPSSPLTSDLLVDFEGKKFGPRDVIDFTLDKLDAAQFKAPFDLTGALVKSSSPIAVLSGQRAAKIFPPEIDLPRSSDDLQEMLPPVGLYGRKFVLVPPPVPLLEVTFRILARDWSTTVLIYNVSVANPVRYVLSSPGSYLHLALTNYSSPYAYVEASQDVMIARYFMANSQPGKMEGDSSMTMLTPSDNSYFSSYTFTTNMHVGSFVTVVIAKGQESGLRVNGVPLEQGKTSMWYWSTMHDVIGRGDVIVVVICLIRYQTIEFYQVHVHHSDDVEFYGYQDGISPRRSESLPLTYARDVNVKVASMAEETENCAVVSEEGKLQVNERSLPTTEVPGVQNVQSLGNMEEEKAKDAKCCLVDGHQRPCKLQQLDSRCRLAGTLTKHGALDVLRSARSMFECQRSCVMTEGCVAANYGSDQPVSKRCLLALNKLQSFSISPSPSHQFMDCGLDGSFTLD